MGQDGIGGGMGWDGMGWGGMGWDGEKSEMKGLHRYKETFGSYPNFLNVS